MNGTLYVIPGEEEDQVTLYAPNPPSEADQSARQIEWSGPKSLTLTEGLPMAAEALQGWLKEKEEDGYRFNESSKAKTTSQKSR